MKRIRNSESLEDQVEVTGGVGDSLNIKEHGDLSFKDLGIQSAAEVEAIKSEACNNLIGTVGTYMSACISHVYHVEC